MDGINSSITWFEYTVAEKDTTAMVVCDEATKLTI